jgi:hypothetical protein
MPMLSHKRGEIFGRDGKAGGDRIAFAPTELVMAE